MAHFSSRPALSRRDWLRLTAAGVGGASLSGWIETLAARAAHDPKRRRACILLWMDGGPSQMDTFDLKPGHRNGGPFKGTATRVPGIRISEHLPKLAKHADRMALVRSMSTGEGEHGRATFLLRTGYLPQGEILYPPLGALVARELEDPQMPLPPFVSIAPNRGVSPRTFGPGFLSPRYAPLVVGDKAQSGLRTGDAQIDQALRVENLKKPADVSARHADARLDLLKELEEEFVRRHPATGPLSHRAAYGQAVRLMHSAAGRAFDLDEEKSSLRDAYGRNLFGQGCLLARRLVERGVPFVEVTLGGLNGGAAGWDTHAENFKTVQRLSEVLDAGWSALMEDLKDRGLLDSTLLVWMGEFGRTPQINAQGGRDHFPTAWTTVLAGGGIKGGQVVGKTSPDGLAVKERPVTVPDFLATVCGALGIDFTRKNISNVDRPIRLVDQAARPLREVLA